MSYALTNFKVSKASIAPILLVIITAVLTVIHFTNPYEDKLFMAPLACLTSIAWMLERFHAVYLHHKVKKLEEKQNGN